MVGPLRPEPHTRAIIEPEPGLLALFGWDFQPFTLPDALDPLVVHVPARLVEQPRHYAIAIASIAAIDEDFLSTVVKHRVVEIGKLLEPRYNGEAGQWVSKFRDVLADGLTMERVEAAGFTVDICRMLIKAEEDLRPSVDITPDMSQEAVSR